MAQGLIGMRNILYDVSERQKAILECLQQSYYFRGSTDEKGLSKVGKPRTRGVTELILRLQRRVMPLKARKWAPG